MEGAWGVGSVAWEIYRKARPGVYKVQLRKDLCRWDKRARSNREGFGVRGITDKWMEMGEDGRW